MGSVVYYVVEKRNDGKLRSMFDESKNTPEKFSGRMLPDRLARALRADGHPCFVVECDLSVETPNIEPHIPFVEF